MTEEPTKHDLEAVKKLNDRYSTLRDEIAKVVVGQEHVLEQILIAIFCRGHCLLVGVPGLAKTLMVSTIAEVLSLSFKRIQFTPDLMPADITGTEILQETSSGDRVFRFMKGPIFANMILADEINRTPPKTQAALLEAMQEHHVTSGNQTFALEEPFFVLATQNPIEQEGTYNLPEAQLDRFMFMILVDYPETEDEKEILRRTTTNYAGTPEQILDGELILKYQRIVREVLVREDIYDYVVRFVQATRTSKDYALPYAQEWLSWGAGPRACQNLILGAKVRAFFEGRPHVTTDDVKAVARPVLRHRIIVNYAAMSEGITTDHVIEELLNSVPEPQAVA